MNNSPHHFEFWSAEINRETPAVDIHGMRVAEALEVVERFLDRALIGHYRVVKIIHGSGTGTLRVATLAHLRTHPHVIAWHESERSEELAAVTYVMLK